MYTLGIDLGTTYTAAAVHRDGRVEICSLGTRTPTVPSVVLQRDDGAFLTGEAAVRRGAEEPLRVAREFKRRFGDTTPVVLGGVPHPPEALAAALLGAVVEKVTADQGGPPARVCLSHPANWGAARRGVLARAVAGAGITAPVEYVAEPVAAAVFYAGTERLAVGDVVAVYDLGGGTFDVAVLRRTPEGFEVLGQPDGIERLGGVDVDAAVYAHVLGALGDRLGALDDDDPATVSAVARLREECTAAKEALSADTQVTIPVLLPGLATQVRLNRSELEAMIRPALHDSVILTERVIRSAGLEPADVARVLLVGGSSRIPVVAEILGAELGRPVTVDAHPKHTVALGAACLAQRDVAAPAATAEPAEPAEPVLVGAAAPARAVAAAGPVPATRPVSHASRPELPPPAVAPAGIPRQAAATSPTTASTATPPANGRRRTAVLVAVTATVVASAVLGGGLLVDRLGSNGTDALRHGDGIAAPLVPATSGAPQAPAGSAPGAGPTSAAPRPGVAGPTLRGPDGKAVNVGASSASPQPTSSLAAGRTSAPAPTSAAPGAATPTASVEATTGATTPPEPSTTPATTAAPPPSPVPGQIPVVSLMARALGTTLMASWNPVSGATAYRVAWTDAGTGADLTGASSAGVTSSGVTILSGTHTYLVKVTPYNAAGDGPTSSATTTATGRTA